MNNTAYSMIARKIPAKVREDYLLRGLEGESNPIDVAQPSGKNKEMYNLAKIWYDYIEPLADRNFECGKCMANILGNWRELKATLVELSKEEKLLNAL